MDDQPLLRSDNISNFAESVFCENSLSVVDGKKSDNSLEDLNNFVRWTLDRSVPRSPGSHRLAPASRDPGRTAGTLLDTLLHNRTISMNQRRRYRVFSRANLGMMLAGDYYFLTLTSKPNDTPIEQRWFSLRRWLRRHYPVIEWVYVITDEGYGVIHMIYRLPEGEKRIPQKEVQEFWGSWVIIKEVREKNKLANYMSDQRKRGLALEMYSQESIIRYRMSKNWVPKAFMVAFGRFFYKNSDLDTTTLNELLADWLLEIKKDYGVIKKPPRQRGKDVFWCNQYDKTVN